MPRKSIVVAGKGPRFVESSVLYTQVGPRTIALRVFTSEGDLVGIGKIDFNRSSRSKVKNGTLLVSVKNGR